MDVILWPSTKFSVQIQLQKFYSTFGLREVYNDGANGFMTSIMAQLDW